MALIESFSGVRGIYKTDLTKEVAIKYAQIFSDFLRKKNQTPVVVIGRDTRESGPELMKAFISNMECRFINVEVLSSPAIQNAVREFNADAGIIITGSHNPPEHNGFKFLEPDGGQLRAENMQILINKAKTTQAVDKQLPNKPENKRQQAIQAYKEFLKNIIQESEFPDIKILIDPNGGAGILSKEIFDDYNINAEYINMNEGEFNRVIEPSLASLEPLAEKAEKINAEFAAGFDCDADRVEIMLPDKTILSGNHLIALAADFILPNIDNKNVVVNDATSYLVKEITEKHNGKLIEVEIGEPNVAGKMKELGSIVGGEGSSSGVMIAPGKCRDGIMALLLILKIIKQKNKSLKELIDELPKYYYLREKVILKKDFTEIRDRVKQFYTDNGFRLQETGDETGGLKAIKDNSWIFFRQSKTEDKVLRIMSDSKDKKTAETLLQQAKEVLDS